MVQFKTSNGQWVVSAVNANSLQVQVDFIEFRAHNETMTYRMTWPELEEMFEIKLWSE